MSDYSVMPVSDSPCTSEGSNSFYEYHHYCSPIFTANPLIFRHENHSSFHMHQEKTNSFASSDPDGITRTLDPITGVPVVKRRNTANKKERRRTQSINAAFQELKDKIPNVPADTKLSKIKTLRLATSYISYLTGVLETDDPAGGFRAEFAGAGIHCGRRSDLRQNNRTRSADCSTSQRCETPIRFMDKSLEERQNEVFESVRKSKSRTGWPQHVWALELKQEQNL